MQNDQCPLQKCSLQLTKSTQRYLSSPRWRRLKGEVSGVSITFVSDSNIPIFNLKPTPSSATNNQVEEYESDSDESVGVDEDFFISN